MNISSLNRLRFIFAVLVSFTILGILFTNAKLETTLTVMRKADLRLLLLAALLSVSVNIIIGALKWRKVLWYINCRLSFKEALSIRTACIPFKVIFPLKSSELLKAFYLNRKKGLSFGRAVGSLLLEKVLNILVTLCILLMGLAFVKVDIPWTIPVLLAVLSIYTVFSRGLIKALVYLGSRIHKRVRDFINELLHSFEAINARGKAVLLLYSLAFQSSEFINTYILLKAVGLSVPFALILVYIPIAMVINNLPVTILGLGTREALFVLLFARYGASGPLLSAGLLVSLVEYLLPLLAGLFFIKPFFEFVSIRSDLTSQKA